MTTRKLLEPGVVARMFGVDPKTVTRWATTGKLSFRRTVGLHGPGPRRYHPDEVRALLNGTPMTKAQIDAMWEAHANGGTL